jgi:predicted secreted hydrolase
MAAGSIARAGEPADSPRLSTLLSDRERTGYAEAIAPRPFAFPADHGPHPGFRNEWWYVTGNLDGRQGRRFGFELTLFRFALAPAEPGAARSGDASAWRTRQLYVAHFAVTDVAAGEFRFEERYARGALGLAGATADPFRVWVEDWWLREFPATEEATSDAWLLHASTDEFAVTLTLEPAKAPVLNGVDGLSQKSAAPGNASYYYSMPRLAARGTLRVDDDVHDVTGLAWLDREWGSSALADDQEGWDWFALQLSDGSDLMFYRLRRADGSADPMSAGTWIPARGESVHLAHDDVRLEPRAHWESPRGGRYPVAWTLAVPRLDLELRIDPVLDDQELDTSVRYWEGAVDVAGRRGGAAIEGRGYVELTGYARAE